MISSSWWEKAEGRLTDGSSSAPREVVFFPNLSIPTFMLCLLGTCVHIDPLGTSAWNTVIEGRKLWVLFPPGTPKRIAKAKDFIRRGEDTEAINYFVDHVSRLLQECGDEHGMVTFIQYPSETVFVPGGWWHAVINLDDTVAITQNYCGRVNFDRVWRKARSGRKKMAVKWLYKLDERYPDLAERGRAINEEDGFEMKTMDDLKREKKRKKKEKKRKKRERETKREERREEEQKEGYDEGREGDGDDSPSHHKRRKSGDR